MVDTPNVGDTLTNTFTDDKHEVVRIDTDSAGPGMIYLARPGARDRHQRRLTAARQLPEDERPHMFRGDTDPPVPARPHILRAFKSQMKAGVYVVGEVSDDVFECACGDTFDSEAGLNIHQGQWCDAAESDADSGDETPQDAAESDEGTGSDPSTDATETVPDAADVDPDQSTIEEATSW